MSKYSGCLHLVRVSLTLSIFKLLTAEAYGTYSTLINLLLKYKILKLITLDS
jgi:hypothetical protein